MGENTMQTSDIRFLYPTSNQFPFDGVCAQIVHELEKRNWEVGGINVEFDTYGSGDAKFCKVSTIEKSGSDGWKLFFCRVQGQVSQYYNDTAAITQINIPGKELNVFSDESGPILYVYVGNDWGADWEQFVHGSKVSSKLHRNPRTYLRYEGSHVPNGSYSYSNQRARYLVHTNDLDREYDPIGNEPHYFETNQVMQEFCDYLNDALKLIQSAPIPKYRKDIFAQDAIPFPKDVGELFCLMTKYDLDRISIGQKNPTKLKPEERCGMMPSWRLLSLGIHADNISDKVYDGFVWCGIGGVSVFEKAREPVSCLNEQVAVKIAPHSANDIYVADHAAYESMRNAVIANLGNRTQFTDDEIDSFNIARAQTMIPITEYNGQFELPIVLIGREVSLDEVELG